jgi:2-polyprenyl-3-methyl-5-hydroxy-6-metoxy-1,4-benzoquinol methylase
MTQFEYLENDATGRKTLEAIAGAKNFNQWMYETILPYCKGEMLELGSGIGNISEFFLKSSVQISLSDIRQNYCDYLRNEFSGYKNLKQVYRIDLTHPDFDNEYTGLFEKFDTVFALNVVEHIEDDSLAIENCKKLLSSGGNLIILVPAYQSLYNRFDKELYHYRRYSKSSLIKLFSKQGLEIVKSTYFNFMGIPGWFFSGKILRNSSIPKGQMKLYDKLVPVFKAVDKILFNKAGLSVIAVGKK